MKTLKVALVIIFLIPSGAFANDTIEGYLNTRIERFNGDYILNKGEAISCTLNKEGKCCFEEEFGEVCIDIDNISKSPVEKIDLKFNFIKFSEKINNNICVEGKEISNLYSDAYHPQYALSVSGYKNAPVLIDVRFYYYNKDDKGESYYIASTLSKRLHIKADNSCHKMSITRKDINNLISEHNLLRKYLDVDFYTSSIRDTLRGNLRFTLISNYIESDYANNVKEIEVIVPIDTSKNWPQY